METKTAKRAFKKGALYSIRGPTCSVLAAAKHELSVRYLDLEPILEIAYVVILSHKIVI